MKSVAITLGALATFVVAQDIPSLPACGQVCANDMLNGQAPGLGCAANDIPCICQNRNFIYGLRDCSAVTCDAEDARRIVEFGIALCRDNGVEITTSGGGDAPTSTGTEGDEDGTATPSGSVSTIFATVTSGDSVITTAIATTTVEGGSDETTNTEETTGTEDGSETPGASTTDATGGLISTVTSEDTTFVTTLTTDDSDDVVSTITSEDTTFVTTLTTDDSGDVVSTITSEDTTFVTTLTTDDSDDVVSTITSEGTTLTTTISTATEDETGTETSTETDGGDDASETTTDEGGAAMPQRTMAPAGVLAAGLAVLLL